MEPLEEALPADFRAAVFHPVTFERIEMMRRSWVLASPAERDVIEALVTKSDDNLQISVALRHSAPGRSMEAPAV